MIKIFILPEMIEFNEDATCLIPSKYIELNDKLYYIDENFDDDRVKAVELSKKENSEYTIERVVLINETTKEIEELNKNLFRVDFFETLREFFVQSEFHIAKQDKEENLKNFIINILEYRMWENTIDINTPTLFIETICSINIEILSDKMTVKSYDNILFEKSLYNFDVYLKGTALIDKLKEIMF